MLTSFLNILGRGIVKLRSNMRLALVAVLVFVFPILFVSVTQSFFSAAYSNVNTVEKQKIDILHDSLQQLLVITRDATELNAFLTEIISDRPEQHLIEIAADTEEGLRIVASTDTDRIGLLQSQTNLYYTANGAPGDSFIFEYTVDGKRTWQSFRQVKTSDQAHYIFSEQDFGVIDSVMRSREQNSYLGLSAIFLFLIALAYWLIKQDHWYVAYRDVSQRLKEQGLFANTIAHELRAPLTAIRGYASFLIESTTLAADNREYVKNISGASDRLLTLINDFLEVARIQSGQMKLTPKQININDTVQTVVREFSSQASQKGLSLKADLPLKPTILEIDADRLQQVLTNLVSNAIKYTDTGSVTVSVEQSRFHTTIKVKDTGHGISAEDQQKLFAPFMRVGNADNSAVVGTGLGMWITKRLVELLSGTITLESIEGVGTHVKIVFKG